MTAAQPAEEAEQARIDALRRRLYRADASEADLQRYLAEQQAEPEPRHVPEDRPAPPRRRGRRVAAVALAVGAIAALIVGVRLAQPTARVPEPAQARVAQRFDAVPRFLVDTTDVSGPVSVATSVRGTPVVGQRYEGVGSAVVPVDVAPGSFDGGRAMIVLTAAQSSPIAWRAVRIITRNDWSSYPIVLAHGSGDTGSIVATPTTFVYPGAPPARIAVDVPEGVRWTLLVAAAAGDPPSLR